jgi:hypothetical protein
MAWNCIQHACNETLSLPNISIQWIPISCDTSGLKFFASIKWLPQIYKVAYKGLNIILYAHETKRYTLHLLTKTLTFDELQQLMQMTKIFTLETNLINLSIQHTRFLTVSDVGGNWLSVLCQVLLTNCNWTKSAQVSMQTQDCCYSLPARNTVVV